MPTADVKNHRPIQVTPQLHPKLQPKISLRTAIKPAPLVWSGGAVMKAIQGRLA